MSDAGASSTIGLAASQRQQQRHTRGSLLAFGCGSRCRSLEAAGCQQRQSAAAAAHKKILNNGHNSKLWSACGSRPLPVTAAAAAVGGLAHTTSLKNFQERQVLCFRDRAGNRPGFARAPRPQHWGIRRTHSQTHTQTHTGAHDYTGKDKHEHKGFPKNTTSRYLFLRHFLL